ncbi:MAG: hypothetical protein JSR80_08455 [Verrucomicrobia bacterium]|nr:hypothetical protein [Verrucomicrobiota bacterium]
METKPIALSLACNEAPYNWACKIAFPLFIAGAGAFTFLRIRKKLSLRTAISGGSTCALAALIGIRSLCCASQKLSSARVLEQIKTKTLGETLDFSNLDPHVTPKELFLAILHHWNEASNLKQIVNCPSFALSESEIPSDISPAAVCTLLPTNASLHLNARVIRCQEDSEDLKNLEDLLKAKPDKNLLISSLTLVDPIDKVLKIFETASTDCLRFEGKWKIENPKQARKSIQKLLPLNIEFKLDFSPKKIDPTKLTLERVRILSQLRPESATNVDWSRLHTQYEWVFKILTPQTKENRELWLEVEDNLSYWKNYFDRGNNRASPSQEILFFDRYPEIPEIQWKCWLQKRPG